ncbi:succinylglutamate desuccinylase/aspartoacylase family protein [Paenibacillus sp. CC-CFT747]|nr:succinylglutamate desuccinylase/aspartoacylase family protein [Paenibacillus sp. CC-CFT747]
MATLAGYYHADSELGRRSRAAAEAFGTALLWGHTDIAGGRSISSAQSLGIPWLYTEAFGGQRIRPEDSEAFFTGTLRLMRHLGMLTGPERWKLDKEPVPLKTIYGDGNFDASVVSETDGFFIPAVPLGSEVACGDKIGAIVSLTGAERQEVRAYADGYLVMVVGTPKVERGQPLYLLASLKP